LAEPTSPEGGAPPASPDPSATPTILLKTVTANVAAAVGDDRAHYLVALEGSEQGRRIELGDRALVIGRCPPADIVLPDALVSRKHCRVGLAMGELFVTDLGSSNGTYVAGRRITGSSLVAPGERVAIGTHVLEHEWRSRREVEAARAQDSDLDKAKQYVRSLLPAPLEEGAVRTDWVLQPSAKLGGDMFGYHFIDPRTFAIYLLDVTGHGADAAMHAVSVMNVLRQPSLPGVDVRDPARVAAYLNEMFQMDSHGGMLLSLWYGVLDLAGGSIAFTSAGHHAAYLVDAAREAAAPLDVSNVLIGMMPGYDYRAGRAATAPGSSLYLFSDGVFEVDAPDGREWGMDAFVFLLTAPAEAGKTESRRILEAVMGATGRLAFEDDFTLVVASLE
jgi:serine phosphatase RsbU (regulator of sigma subunit)